MKNFLFVISFIILIAAITYGSYWVFKNGSYYFFYEDMVIETIKEKVKKDSLIN